MLSPLLMVSSGPPIVSVCVEKSSAALRSKPLSPPHSLTFHPVMMISSSRCVPDTSCLLASDDVYTVTQTGVTTIYTMVVRCFCVPPLRTCRGNVNRILALVWWVGMSFAPRRSRGA